MTPRRAGVLLFARLKSTRLKRKVLLDVAGDMALAWLIKRAQRTSVAQAVVVCTSTLVEDDPVAEIAFALGASVFRGSPDDLLQRLMAAAAAHELDFVAVGSGDDILTDPELTDAVLQQGLSSGVDFLTCHTLPLGVFTPGVSRAALEEACAIKEASETEAWEDYFTATGRFRVAEFEPPADVRRPDLRLTMDYPADYALICELYRRLLRTRGPDFRIRDVIRLFEEEPRLVRVNAHLDQQYRVHLATRNPVRLKERV